MGEYARYKGQEIKIGTCESMYYLRADQAHLVEPLPNSLDPLECADRIRFRFPWPDEDHVEPGAFERYARTAGLYVDADPEVDHGTVQFSAHAGYLISLPCPESAVAKASTLKIARNGFAGSTHIAEQRCLDGVRMLVCQCGGCGSKWRMPTLDDARPIIAACIKEAEQREHEARIRRDATPESIAHEGKWWREVARRIEEGYTPGAGNLPRRLPRRAAPSRKVRHG